LEEQFKILALCGLGLEFVIMTLTYKVDIKRGLCPLFFGVFTAAIAADVFTEIGRSLTNIEQEKKPFLQLFFETATVISCLANFATSSNVMKNLDDGLLEDSPKPKSQTRGRTNPLFDTSTVLNSYVKNGHTSPKRRQRRDSASPGRVGNMLSTLSLGRSDTNNHHRPDSGYGSSILAPARFHPPSSSSHSSPSLRGANSPFSEQSYLWPSRFPSPKKTVIGPSGDNDDVVSVFSSVSQKYFRRPVEKDENNYSTTSSTPDRFWKILLCLVLLCSFSTNAVVLYYVLSRG